MAIVSAPAATPPPVDAGGDPPPPPQPAPGGTPAKVDLLLDGTIVSPEIPQRIVMTTAVLTLVCVVFALLLCGLVIYCAMQQRASELMIRLLMSCVACFVGLAFASLGFGLFLLRARGGFRARLDAGQGTSSPALLESTAPGLVVVVCATVVMWLALRVKFEIKSSTTGPTPSSLAAPAPRDRVTTPEQPPTTTPATDDGVTPP